VEAIRESFVPFESRKRRLCVDFLSRLLHLNSEEENRRESFNFSLHKCSMPKLLTVLCKKTTINVKRGTEDVNLFVSQRCDIY
jgi:hypothetical protein